jgi:hypothetical protein
MAHPPVESLPTSVRITSMSPLTQYRSKVEHRVPWMWEAG